VGLSHLTPDEVAAWVAASCAAQGVPVKVTDPTVVRRVGTLLGVVTPERRGRKRSGPRPSGAAASVAPHEGHAGGVQHLSAGLPGTDHHMVDDGFDDGLLPGQAEGLPISA
jgi:hypothetical protein